MLKAESHLLLCIHLRAWYHRPEWRIDTHITEMLSCSFHSMLQKLYSWLTKKQKEIKTALPPQHTSVSGLEVIWETTKSFCKSYHECLTFNQSIWNKVQPLLVSQYRLRQSNYTKSYSGDYLNTKEETGSTKWLLHIFSQYLIITVGFSLISTCLCPYHLRSLVNGLLGNWWKSWQYCKKLNYIDFKKWPEVS